MPIPHPHANEGEEAFVARCMSNPVMMKEFPSKEQRLAVAYGTFRHRKSARSRHALPRVEFPCPHVISDRHVRRIKGV